VIPHGVDQETFYVAPSVEIDSVAEKHAVTRAFVLFVGNIEPRKNIGQLVRAIDLLNHRGTDVELLVVGKPAWKYEETLRMVAESPNSRHLGRLPDQEVRALMSGCAAFAFPSRYEGFGLPVLEALACGAPVACSRRGSLSEVAGSLACYADDLGPDAIAASLVEAMALPRSKHRARAVAHAATFSWEESARRHKLALQGALR